MPILKREPDLFPDGLFGLSNDEAPWWVAHVRSRQEKALVRLLRPLAIPHYLPLYERRIRREGRWFHSHLPLFSGYLFFRGGLHERYEVLQTGYLVQVIEVLDQTTLTDELSQLRRLQEMGVPLIPHAFLSPGDRVRVIEGPFKGYEGVVLRGKGPLRLVVSVSMLRRSVSVELDRESLAPLARAA